MKLLGEYLEHALQFERLAADEDNPKLKAQLESQARAYRKLAAERATKLGWPAPSVPTLVKENLTEASPRPSRRLIRSSAAVEFGRLEPEPQHADPRASQE
jgi:hypothetical protein